VTGPRDHDLVRVRHGQGETPVAVFAPGAREGHESVADHRVAQSARRGGRGGGHAIGLYAGRQRCRHAVVVPLVVRVATFPVGSLDVAETQVGDAGAAGLAEPGERRGVRAQFERGVEQAAPGEQVDLPTTAVFDPGSNVISFQPVEGALIESFSEGLHEVQVIFWKIEDGPEQALSYRWEFTVV